MKYKFTLAEDIQTRVAVKTDVEHPFFTLKSGVLTIKQGYSWDGMTLYPDDKTTYLASLFHDCLYQMMQLRLIPVSCKFTADLVLLRQLIKDNHSKYKAFLVYAAVTVFGYLYL